MTRHTTAFSYESTHTVHSKGTLSTYDGKQRHKHRYLEEKARFYTHLQTITQAKWRTAQTNFCKLRAEITVEPIDIKLEYFESLLIY